MNRDQLEELAALHALDLLEGEEKRAFEERVRNDPEARDIAVRLGLAAAGLALTADPVEPPASLKARVMASLPDRAGSSTQFPSQSQSQAQTRSSASKSTATSSAADDENKIVAFRWLPWALAASLALVCGLVVKSNLALRERTTIAEDDAKVLRTVAAVRDTEIKTAQNELDRAKKEAADLGVKLAEAVEHAKISNLRVAILESQLKESPTTRAFAAWNGQTQEGVFTVENLPPAPAGMDYQLWIVDPQYKTPVDGGVFKTTSDGKVEYRFKGNQPVAAVAAFAVSLEKAGGVPVAEGTMVLLGK